MARSGKCHRSNTCGKFGNRIQPLLAARALFFVIAALILVFGIGPVGFDVAKKGILKLCFRTYWTRYG